MSLTHSATTSTNFPNLLINNINYIYTTTTEMDSKYKCGEPSNDEEMAFNNGTRMIEKYWKERMTKNNDGQSVRHPL